MKREIFCIFSRFCIRATQANCRTCSKTYTAVVSLLSCTSCPKCPPYISMRGFQSVLKQVSCVLKFQFPVEQVWCFFFLISSELQRASSPEQEDGIIPDSPVLPSSLPVVNRLKKDRNPDRMKHVRYAEVPLLPSNNSLFKGQSAPS